MAAREVIALLSYNSATRHPAFQTSTRFRAQWVGMTNFDVPCGKPWAAYVREWTLEFEFAAARRGGRRGHEVNETIVERIAARLRRDDARTRKEGRIVWSATALTGATVESKEMEPGASWTIRARASSRCRIELVAYAWGGESAEPCPSLALVSDPAQSHYDVVVRTTFDDGTRNAGRTRFPFRAAGPLATVPVPPTSRPLTVAHATKESADGVAHREGTRIRLVPEALIPVRDRSALDAVDAMSLDDVDPVPLPLPVAVAPSSRQPRPARNDTEDAMALAGYVLGHPNILLADAHQ